MRVAHDDGDTSVGDVVVGLDVGGTKVAAVALDASSRIIKRGREATPSGAAALTETLARLGAAIASEVSSLGGQVVGLGVGLPGLIDRAGTLKVAPNLPGVVDYAPAYVLTERLGLPVAMDNDNTCGALAEWEARPDLSDFLYVGLGTGIGGGVISNGHLVRGASGFAGEFGHMVVQSDGPLCGCGRRGCWELFASGNALGRMAREEAHLGRATEVVSLAGGALTKVRGEHVCAAVANGDPEAIALLKAFACRVVAGLLDLINLVDPQAVILGGGMFDAKVPGNAAVLLADLVAEELGHKLLGGRYRPVPEVITAYWGADAGAVGAALMARSIAVVGS